MEKIRFEQKKVKKDLLKIMKKYEGAIIFVYPHTFDKMGAMFLGIADPETLKSMQHVLNQAKERTRKRMKEMLKLEDVTLDVS